MKAPLTVAHLDRRNSHKKSRNTLPHRRKGDTPMKSTITYINAIDTAIAAMIEQGTSHEYVEKMQALRRSIEKRNSGERKPTKAEQAKADADAVLRDKVREVLGTAAEPMTVTAIKDSAEDFTEVKVQKLSAIVRKMLIDGEVKRDEVKHKAVFALA